MLTMDIHKNRSPVPLSNTLKCGARDNHVQEKAIFAF